MGVFFKERYEFILSGKITQRLIPGPENTLKRFAEFSLRYFPRITSHLPDASDVVVVLALQLVLAELSTVE